MLRNKEASSPLKYTSTFKCYQFKFDLNNNPHSTLPITWYTDLELPSLTMKCAACAALLSFLLHPLTWHNVFKNTGKLR